MVLLHEPATKKWSLTRRTSAFPDVTLALVAKCCDASWSLALRRGTPPVSAAITERTPWAILWFEVTHALGRGGPVCLDAGFEGSGLPTAKVRKASISRTEVL